MEQPTGFEIKGREAEVFRLHRSLYGLKQASRAWNEKFNSFFVMYGFTRGMADPCVYFLKKTKNVTSLPWPSG